MNPSSSRASGTSLLAERPEPPTGPELELDDHGRGPGNGGGNGDDDGGGGGWGGGRGDDGRTDRPWYRPSARALVRAVTAVAVIASFGVWGYAYSGKADRPAIDLLDDRTFAQAAEPQCATALAELAALPQSFDARSGPDRSAQVRRSTDRLQAMVEQLQAEVTGTDRDQRILNGWLNDWRTVLSDRYRYAQAVADDPSARYLMTDIKVNEFLNTRVTRVAKTNSMPSCGVPDDVG